MTLPFIDTHLDTMWQSHKSNRTFGKRSEAGHIDLPRAREAGLLVGFFTGYPTSDAPVTEEMMANWIRYYLYDPEAKITQITNLKELNDHIAHFSATPEAQRSIGNLLHFEGAAGIDSGLNKLYIYHKLGLRSMSLTWNETNHFATGQENRTDRGLTEDGKNLLSAMVDLGIMIDVSHLNDASFWDVHGSSNAPIFASHSNIRTEVSSHMRNLTPEMAQAIADSGGTIGVNFCTGFLRDDKEVSINTVVDMYSTVLDLVGPKHVHVGSDMDGCTLPDDMKDITAMPELFTKLQADLSLTESELEGIASGNMVRMMKSYWQKL